VNNKTLLTLLDNFPDCVIYVYDYDYIVQYIGGSDSNNTNDYGKHLNDVLGDDLYRYLEYYISKSIRDNTTIKINHSLDGSTYLKTIFNIGDGLFAMTSINTSDTSFYQNMLRDSNHNLKIKDRQLYELSITISHHVRNKITNMISIFDLYERGLYHGGRLIDDTFNTIMELRAVILHLSKVLRMKVTEEVSSDISLLSVLNESKRNLVSELISFGVNISNNFTYMSSVSFNRFSLSVTFTTIIKFLIENTALVEDKVIDITSSRDNDGTTINFRANSILSINIESIFDYQTFNTDSHGNLFTMRNQLSAMDSDINIAVGDNYTDITLKIWENMILN